MSSGVKVIIPFTTSVIDTLALPLSVTFLEVVVSIGLLIYLKSYKIGKGSITFELRSCLLEEAELQVLNQSDDWRESYRREKWQKDSNCEGK